MIVQKRMSRVSLAGLAIAVLLAAVAPIGTAMALEPRADEKERLKACEKSLCQLIVSKKPTSGDLQCPLSKAWSRKTMKEGAANKMRWGFGAAKCEVDLQVPRDMIVGALSADEIKVTLPTHTVECEVERESAVDKARITLAPIIEFKEGKAKKIWVNVMDIKAPGVIKGVVWSAAQLEDSVGVFHRRMIKAVNKFIAEQCPKVVAGG
jgi:hypothetical protein